MNTRELNFAYKVRNALNENLDNLPPSTVDKLVAARKLALSRKKQPSPLRALLAKPVLASNSGSVYAESPSWLFRMGAAIPFVVLLIGLTSIYQHEKERRIADTAEIDAEVLSDELPLSAYLDHGFNAYLAKRVE
jgi:hypothetical protein